MGSHEYQSGWGDGRDELAEAIIEFISVLEYETDDVHEFSERLIRFIEQSLTLWEEE